MSIGYACLVSGLKDYSLNSLTLKNLHRSEEVIAQNLATLARIIKYNSAQDIKLFRISSDIIPLASHPQNKFPWRDSFKRELSSIGELIKSSGIRVSMHPGQYTVLNSNREDVVKNSINDLKYHCDFLDSLGLDSTHKIVLHIGGVYGDKESAIQRFLDNFKTLDSTIKSRLIIENDERSYDISEVIDIGLKLRIPVVFDNLHHSLNPPSKHKSEFEWIKDAGRTWGPCDGVQKIHYSQQSVPGRLGAHSKTIYIHPFLNFYTSLCDTDIDIMLEVKDKNLSALKCIHCTGKPSIGLLEREWAKYKYLVLYHSQSSYNALRELLKDKEHPSPLKFYSLIELALDTVPSPGGIDNAIDHVWGYFKDLAGDAEKTKFRSLCKLKDGGNSDTRRIKRFLYKLSLKYDRTYLLSSYFFYDI